MVHSPGNLPADIEDLPTRISWPMAFLVFTAAGLLRFTYLYLDDVTRSVPGTVVHRLIEEATGAYAALLFFPLVAAVERRFPLSSGRWRRNWVEHVATFVAYSITHTTLLAVSRAWLFPPLGQGTYDYGRMPTRYFMEAPQDVISYGAFVGVLTFLRVQRLLRQRELRSATIERDAAAAQLQVLSLRLQPHFLFNALNTISSVVYEDPVVADTMIGRLGDLLRQALRTHDRQQIAVRDELDTVHAYLSFVEARFGDRVHVALEVDPAANDVAIPAFLLQPLIENAVHHSTAIEQRGTSILIALSLAAERLTVVVENDVENVLQEPPRNGTGLGTTRARIRLLYGDAATFSALASNGRFRVQISFPATAASAIPPTNLTNAYAGADR